MRLQPQIVIFCFVFSAGCTMRGVQPLVPEGVSGVSEISMNLPDRATITGPNKDRLNGYRLVIEALDDACPNATSIDRVGGWSDTTLGAKVQQGCDYSIGLILGNVADSAMATPYFSNYAGPKRGQRLNKADIDGKAKVRFAVNLKITDEGVAAGFDHNPGGGGGTTTGNSSDVIIDAIIDGGGTEGDDSTGTDTGDDASDDGSDDSTSDDGSDDSSSDDGSDDSSSDDDGAGTDGGGSNANFAAVKPIFDAHCAECHHEGQSFDFTQFPFSSAANLPQKTIADKIEQALANGQMPPSPREKLSDDQIARVKAFTDSVP